MTAIIAHLRHLTTLNIFEDDTDYYYEDRINIITKQGKSVSWYHTWKNMTVDGC